MEKDLKNVFQSILTNQDIWIKSTIGTGNYKANSIYYPSETNLNPMILQWDPNNPNSILEACKKFLEFKKQGKKFAYGEHQIEEFDQNLGKLEIITII